MYTPPCALFAFLYCQGGFNCLVACHCNTLFLLVSLGFHTDSLPQHS